MIFQSTQFSKTRAFWTRHFKWTDKSQYSRGDNHFQDYQDYMFHFSRSSPIRAKVVFLAQPVSEWVKRGRSGTSFHSFSRAKGWLDFLCRRIFVHLCAWKLLPLFSSVSRETWAAAFNWSSDHQWWTHLWLSQAWGIHPLWQLLRLTWRTGEHGKPWINGVQFGKRTRENLWLSSRSTSCFSQTPWSFLGFGKWKKRFGQELIQNNPNLLISWSSAFNIIIHLSSFKKTNGRWKSPDLKRFGYC